MYDPFVKTRTQDLIVYGGFVGIVKDDSPTFLNP